MTTQVVVPQLGESVVEATVGEWLKQEGDTVSVGEVIVSLETDKVDVEVGAETSGVLTKIERQVGEDVAIGDVLAIIEEDGAGPQPDGAPQEAPAEAPQAEAPQAAAPTATAPAQPAAEAADADRVTPVARRMAQEQGIDLAQVSGTGAGGRVTKQDVESFLRQQPAAPEARQPEQQPAPPPQPAPAPAAPAPMPAALSGQPEREERQRMSRRRRTIAQRLVEAQQTAAMLTTFNEIDMTAVIEMRKRWRDSFQQQHGIKLGFMSFFVKASVGALKAFPRLNAEIDGDEIVLKRYYDIGMAIGAEEGLVVPVIRDADRLSFAAIEQAIKDYVDKVQGGSLTLEDLRGGTFTITNGGVFGSLLSTPILNPPQIGRASCRERV